MWHPGAVDKTSSSFSAHGKINNFIIIIIILERGPRYNDLLILQYSRGPTDKEEILIRA